MVEEADYGSSKNKRATYSGTAGTRKLPRSALRLQLSE